MRLPPQLYAQSLQLAAGLEWIPPRGFWLFLYLSEGFGYRMGPGGTFELSPGVLSVEAPASPAYFRASQLSDVRGYWFLLDIEHVFGVLTLPERAWLRQGSRTDWLNAVFRLEPGDPLSQLCREMFGGLAEESAAISHRVKMLGIVAAYLSRVLPPPPSRRHPFLNSTERLEQLLGTVTEAEFLAMSVDEMAEHCRCDRRRVLQIFRQVAGASFRDCQGDLRKLRVSQMMEQGASLAEIARECGYDSPESFRAWFRRAFGTGLNRWSEAQQAGLDDPLREDQGGGTSVSL